MWIVFHTSYLTRRMLKIMYGPVVALFDDLLPSTGEQLPQIPADGWIPHGIFQGAALVGTHPRGTEPEAYTSVYKCSGIVTPMYRSLPLC